MRSFHFHFIQDVVQLPVAGCAVGRRRHGYVVCGVCVDVVCGVRELTAATVVQKELTGTKNNSRGQH